MSLETIVGTNARPNVSLAGLPAYIGRALRWWFGVRQNGEGYRGINRLKLLQIVLFTIFLLTSVSNYLADLPYSLTITISGTVTMVFLRYQIEKGWLRSARILFSFYLILVAFALNYVEGTSSGSYFFYFLVMIIANFISTKERMTELLFLYIFTFLTLIATFLVCPVNSHLQHIEAEARTINLLMNGLVSFLIGGFVSYNMMKDNFLKEKALVTKQRFLDSVYNTSFDAVFIVDISSGLVTDCNDQSLYLFQAGSKADLIGKPAFSFFHELSTENSDLVKDFLANTVTMWKGQLTCIGLLGNTFPGYVSAVPLSYEGTLQKKINILDISDIKKAKADLIAAKEKAEQAFMARTRFLSNMSHELRTPLNGIIGTTNLLLQDEYPESQKQYFNVLKYSSDHMLSLINDILDFSKIEAGKMNLEESAFDLESLIHNICNLFEKQFAEKGVALKTCLDEQLNASLIGDQTRLSQVLSNLISNAYKFTEEGEVIVSVSQIARNSNACTVRFEVKDSGIGIPQDKQRVIFDSFTQVDTATTRKFGGTGLGLSISARIVELFGGQLRVDSAVGRGSLFYFTIQLGIDEEHVSYVNEDAIRELNSLKGLRVLVAEDNPINMLIARAILDKWDISITEAVNGKEAVEKFAGGIYDVLLVDLEMPELDGFEVLDNIRIRDHDIPVIAFTAAVYENMQAHLINKGFNDYIQKPFRPEELHAKLARYKVA